MDLTRRQKEIFDFVKEFIAEHRYSPSVRDIASHFSLTSAGGVHKHLKNLKEKGYISLEKNTSRSIRIADRFAGRAGLPENQSVHTGLLELPLKGKVAAGFPIQYALSNETIPCPESMVPLADKSYVLQVQGDSMIEECICDGDYVIVEHRETAENGEMVVAMIDLTEATLKKFYLEGNNVRLQPANYRMEPIIVDPHRVSIHGIVVGVLRSYR